MDSELKFPYSGCNVHGREEGERWVNRNPEAQKGLQEMEREGREKEK